MARIWSEGWETQSLLMPDGSGTYVLGPNTGVFVAGYQGGSAIRMGTSGGVIFPVNETEFYMRVLFHTALAASIVDHIIFRNESAATQASVRFGEGTTIRLFVNGVQVAASTQLFTSWGRIEVYYLFDNSGQIIVRLNGTDVINWSGDSAVSGTMIGDLFITEGTVGVFMACDDVAINDTTGAENDSWVGNGRIRAIIPNGNGASSQWVGSDGNSTDNYLLVDDVPNDGDTTYVRTSAAAQTDDYELSTVTLAAGETVKNVWSEIIVRKDTGTPPFVRHGYISGGTTVESGDIDPTTTYARYAGEASGPDNPDTSVAWVQADIDALKSMIRTV